MSCTIKGFNKTGVYKGKIKNIRDIYNKCLLKKFEDRDKLVTENMRLVHFVAKKYTNLGLEYEDLISEGSIGLIEAARKYDPTLGYKFSTHATWWIRQAITRAIADTGRTVRIPVHMLENVTKMKKAETEFILKYNYAPSVEELAEYAEISVQQINFMKKISQDTVSLDTPMRVDDDSQTLRDLIPNDDIKRDPVGHCIENSMGEEIYKLLLEFPKRERYVIMQRFGLNELGKHQTLREVGEALGVTRERVRQIEKKALNKLKKMTKDSEVKIYIK